MPDIVPTYWIIPINLEVEEHWALAIIVNCDGELTGDTKNCVIPEIVNDGKPCIIYLDSYFSISSKTLKALARGVRAMLKHKEAVS